MSALVLAAHSGHRLVAELLLEKSADPNAAAVGYTALHAAVLRGDVNVVNDLLSHGANPNAQITKGTALRRNSQDFSLPAAFIGATPYWLAAKFLEPDIMRALAAGGADPAMPIKDGTTPLMAAAGLKEGNARDADRRGLIIVDGGKLPDESRALEAVKVALVDQRSIDEVDRNGDTALHAAALMGYDSVVKLLADYGVKLNVKNNRGLTPLSGLTQRRAADALHSSTANLLRKLGAIE
jgi:ankyrin repeat protein